MARHSAARAPAGVALYTVAILREAPMLLRGLTWLVAFQLLGTVLNVLFLPMLPGPLIGMVLLFAGLLARGRASESLQLAASRLLRYLPLLLIPPAVAIGRASCWEIGGQFV